MPEEPGGLQSVATESDTPEVTKQQQSANAALSESASHSVTSSSLWPHDYSPPGSSAHGTIQARRLEWVAILSSRGSSWSWDRTRLSCTVGRFFAICAIREAQYDIKLVGYLEICKMSTGPDNWSASYTWKLLSKKLRSWSSVTYSLSQLQYKLGKRPILVVNFPYQCFFQISKRFFKMQTVTK